MNDLVRLSFSLERPLAQQLEALVAESSYTNRSEFIRDMIRERLVEKQWSEDDDVVGTITLVYDHHAYNLTERLTDLQHHHHNAVLASTHVHLDAHHCAEMILTKGPAGEIKKIADLLRCQRGVLHAALSFSSTGHDLA